MPKSISLENRKTVKKALSWLTKNTNSMSTLEAIRLSYDPPPPHPAHCIDAWIRVTFGFALEAKPLHLINNSSIGLHYLYIYICSQLIFSIFSSREEDF